MTVPFTVTSGSNHIPYGEISYYQYGTFTWTVPVGVTSISAVCIGAGAGGGSTVAGGGGGGALVYVNNVSVTPGETLTIYVAPSVSIDKDGGISSIRNAAGTELVAAGGGKSGSGTREGGTVITGTGFAGGAGGASGTSNRSGGGGGAAGYGANGGAGTAGASNPATPTNATGGAATGGQGQSTVGVNGENGGGTCIGIGSGSSGNYSNSAPDGSSYYSSYNQLPTAFGAGAGGGDFGFLGPQISGGGAVKIVWTDPVRGPSRTFPMTRVNDTVDFDVYLVSSTTSTTSTIVIPPFVQSGDIGFLIDSPNSNNTTIPTSVIPSGWVGIATTSISSSRAARSIISYKSLSTSDANTTITGMNGATNSKILFIARPNTYTNSVSFQVSFSNQQATTGANPSDTFYNSGTGDNKSAFITITNARANGDITLINTGGHYQQFLNTTHCVHYHTTPASSGVITFEQISMSAVSANFQILQTVSLIFSMI